MTDQMNRHAAGHNSPPQAVEPLLTVQAAAAALNVHVWALRRAIKKGLIPAYTPFNGRILVRLSEVIAAIENSKIGGLE